MVVRPSEKRAYTTPGYSAAKVEDALRVAGYGAVTFGTDYTDWKRVKDGAESVVRVHGQRNPRRRWGRTEWVRFRDRYGMTIYHVGKALAMEATKSG